MRIVLLVLLINIYLFSRIIDFQEVYNLTLENSLELKIKKLDIKISKKELEEIKAFNYGSLFFSFSLSRTNHSAQVFAMKLSTKDASFKDFGFSQMNEGLNTIPNDLNNPKAYNMFENKIVYDLNLFSGFKIKSLKKIKKLQVLAKTIKYTYDEKKLSLEILKAYNGAVSAKYYLKAAQSAKEITSTFVYDAKEFYKEGLTRKIDIKLAEVQLSEVNSKIIEAKNSYNLFLAYLRFLSNDNSITDVKSFKSLIEENIKLKDYQDLAIKQRADYLHMKYKLKTLKENINISKSSLYPQINTHFEYALNTKNLNDLDKNHDSYLVNINLKYSLFNLTDTSNIQKNKITYSKAKIYSKLYENQIKLDVKKKYLDFQSFKNIYDTKIKTNEVAEDIMFLSKQMYLNKLITMNELLKSQSKTYESKANLIKAKFDLNLSYASLLLSYGESLKDK